MASSGGASSSAASAAPRQERGRNTMDMEGDDGRYAGAAGVFESVETEARDGPAKCALARGPGFTPSAAHVLGSDAHRRSIP